MGGFFRSKLQDSVQNQLCMNRRMFETPNHQAQLQSPERNSGKKSSNQESEGKKSKLDRVRQETCVVPVMIERLETDATRDKKDNRPLLHRKHRHRLTERNPQKVQVAEGKVPQFRADISLGESVRTRHVIIGTLPCVSIASLTQDAHVAKNTDSDTLRLMGSPVRSRRKVM